jgi:hypothetical protein
LGDTKYYFALKRPANLGGGQEIAQIDGNLSSLKPTFRGDASMWKQRAVSLCVGITILPLVVCCSTGVGGPPHASAPPPAYAPSQAYAPTPALAPSEIFAPAPLYTPPSPASAVPADVSAAQVYTLAPSAPAAIVVMLPGAGAIVTANPQLWAAQGFDVVTPTPSEIYRLVADQDWAMARLIAQGRALADAPVWLVGPNSAIETAMTSLRPGRQVAGIVVTSTSSGERTCSERMIYSYSGTGAPKVSVSKSGNACPPEPPFGGGSDTTVAPPAPTVPPHTPRIIETTLPALDGSSTAQKKAVQQIADLIKAPPS